MENLLSQFFLAPTTTPGTVSVGKQSSQNAGTPTFDKFLEKASQIGAESAASNELFTDGSATNNELFSNLSPEQLQTLSLLYAQLQNQSAGIQPQPLIVSNNQLGNESITPQIDNQALTQSFNVEQLQFLQQLAHLSQSTIKDEVQLLNVTPQKNLADKIFQIIESQSVAQNISVQATNVNTTASTDTATSAQTSTNFSTALNAITEPKIKPENTKAEYSATSNLITAKVGKEDAISSKVLPSASPQNTNFTEARGISPSALSTSGTESTEHSSIFSQLFATTTSSTSQTTLNGQTPVVLPSGRLVYDDQVLQQFSNQIRINTSEMQQKINIRLNPAELGELKIDLTMKEGGVRVNVLAHSQQAQEILERNMPKLRNVLEKQGLSVEGITVTQAPSTLSDFGHFQDQLTQDQSSQKQQHKDSHSHDSSVSQKAEDLEDTLEITSIGADNNSNSVNLVA